MQVYGTSQIHGAHPVSGPNAARGVQQAPASSAAEISDRLDISEAGQIASRLAEVPDIRADRVQQLRAAIESGAYETEEKLSLAVERLLDEIA
jgi:anti-sigma28 factor (negative regulator of flagellin synthesis)